MAVILTLQGPETGRAYPLKAPCTIVGRQMDADICLTGKAVSRHHAQIFTKDASPDFWVEDLGSSNGTFVNGKRLTAKVPVPLGENDTLQIGPYLLALRKSLGHEPETPEPDYVVRETVNAVTLNQSVYGNDPVLKLQIVLEIAQLLARTLEMEPLLDKLLEYLLKLFPHSDRAMVLLYEGENLMVRGQRCRGTADPTTFPYSRTIVRKALDEGVGILSEDVRSDQRFQASQTLMNLDVRTLLCVPLINKEGTRLGVLQVDRFRKGSPFKVEDLQILTAVGFQVSVALENAALHAEHLREQRLHQELALAREIQQGFLPTDAEDFAQAGLEVFGCMFPAREVAGDLYDYFRLAEGRLSFYIGDVSGKGMPASLYMVAVRTLCRHLAQVWTSPAQALAKLNSALVADNPTGMFVTMIHGLFDGASGEVVLASAGHPPPLLRRANGQVEELKLAPGRLLGFEGDPFNISETRLALQSGDTLVLYTDGATEAHASDSRTMFGSARLAELVKSLEKNLPLPTHAQQVKETIQKFTGSKDLFDDLTLLLLRRK